MRTKSIATRFMAVFLTLGLLLTQFGMISASAAGSSVEINIESPQSGTGYTYDSTSHTVTIISGGTYEISGTGAVTVNKIVVQSGVTADITLNNVNIDVSGTDNACAFDMTGATVSLTLSETNKLLSGKNKAGLEVPEGSTLTISAADNNQSLTAIGRENGAGIGGSLDETAGSITISGGTVNATGGNSDNPYNGIGGAGIGGGGGDGDGIDGNGGNGGNIIITGGVVNATSCGRGAGIGGGASNQNAHVGGSGGVITLRGGKITAISNLGGAGIGGSFFGASGVITVYGGDITAKSPCDMHPTWGDTGAAGIGGGYYANTGDIRIYGGKINALAAHGAAVGCGASASVSPSACNITIENADVTATSYDGACIGGGLEGNVGNITITNSTITVTGTMGGAGIGGGTEGTVASITITGCTIEAVAQGNGAGIGGGLNKDGGSITIQDSDVTTTACSGAGIGGGCVGNGGTITIKSSQITAQSVMSDIGYGNYIGGGAAIGGGINRSGGTITIQGGVISATANGGYHATRGQVGGAGIGGGSSGNGGIVNILGGTVTATGSHFSNGSDSAYAAGIGAGYNGNGGSVTISGSGTTVTAYGVSGHVMAIGSANSSGGTLSVSGNAALNLQETGTNAATTFTDCTVSGSGAENQSITGTYVSGVKYHTITLPLSASSNTAKAHDVVTLTATLSGLEEGIPSTGTVTFRYGNTVIKRGTPISGGQATAIWTPDAGSYTLTAEYVQGAGDSYAASSTAQLTNYVVGTGTFTVEDIPAQTYTGSEIKPVLSVKNGNTALTEGTDYTVSYTNNVNAGTANATVTGINNYAGSVSKNFTIMQKRASITALPSAGSITVVGKLSSAKLSGGSCNVAGTFSWTNPDTVVSASGSYEVTFTPANTNYSSSPGMVNVTVDKTVANTSSDVILDLSGVTLQSGVTSVTVGSSILPESGENNGAYATIDKLFGDASSGNLKKLVVYDLRLLDQDGNAIENFTGEIKVKVKIPSGMSGDLHVFWYDDGTGKLTDMNATQEDDYLVFDTTHFSFYAIAQLDTSAPVANPKTGDNGQPVIPLALLGIGSATGFVTMKRRLRFKRVK